MNRILALTGGLLLALMINSSSLMAKHSSPLFASWIIHGIGSVAAFLLVLFFSKGSSKDLKNLSHQTQQPQQSQQPKDPLWSYSAGFFGAMTVVLASITVNSELGLSGALVLMLIGQILFGLISDVFGLFGTPKRKLIFKDLIVVVSVLTGSAIIIFFRS